MASFIWEAKAGGSKFNPFLNYRYEASISNLVSPYLKFKYSKRARDIAQ